MSRIKFFKNFLLKPVSTGAIYPTGRDLSHELIRYLNMPDVRDIAEIGPGTGAVTKHLIDKIHQAQNFFAVELNPEFYFHIKDVYPEVKVYNDNASNLQDIMIKEKIESLDSVISGLPWAAFPEKIQISILEAIHTALKNNGYFSTFAYLQGIYLPTGKKFRKLLDKYFSDIKISKVVWKNVPPAIVYHCKK